MRMALAEAFSKLDIQSIEVSIVTTNEEAAEFNTSVEKLDMWKKGFYETYSVDKVHTLEHGFKMPKLKRKGWLACGNY